ncbi:inorganic diphosphatase [Suttonella sp. R2A3]|uniref:inorganic diphosphatase n=1 Tax=Suttonella sp. R2A3 TaxID=2908648 RepID=UPI001F31D5ED|nr:inorganic diphosphatase [Suttonella sp. R2A3]UJF23699.1 inorganic diphosphatase [Suttonella sp. R2A3]
MSLNDIPAGDNLPETFNAIIEIAANAGPVKYEIDKDSGTLAVDRFLPTAMFYPANYGYIPHTLCDDGDPLDVLVLTPHAVMPGCSLEARALGVLRMTDEKGGDAKLLAVPTEKSCPMYAHYQSLDDLPPLTLEQIRHFFEQYKALEKGKWAKIDGWGDKAEAITEIENSVKLYQEKG